MTTAARSNRQPRRKPSTRPRRDTADAAEARRLHRDRDAEVKRILKTIRVRAAEQALEASPIGAELLRLTDLRSKALFRQQFASLALTTTQQDAKRAWEHHRNVCAQGLHQQFDSAHFALKTAEARVRKAKKLYAAAVTARELRDAELRLLAEAARA